MPDALSAIDIPNRALFKAAEVCELVKVQPYVLRTWEAEFPELGVPKGDGGARVYRRTDVEQVVRIKHLLLVEGLTLAGARRKLHDTLGPVAADAPVIDELMGQHARERLTEVKRGLQSILELLAGRSHAADFRLTAPGDAASVPTQGIAGAVRVPPARRTAPESKAKTRASASARPSPRRKR